MQPTPLGKIVAAGAIGGLLSGLFGVGGGIVMVPLFVLWLGLDQKRAIATSLIAIIPISILGLVGYAAGGSVRWDIGLALGLGSIVGAQIGVRLLPAIPVPYVQGMFAVLLVYSAYRLAFPSGGEPILTAEHSQPWLLLGLVGVLAGMIAGLLGVGGGVVLVPAMVLLAGLDLNAARGTSLMVVLITACTASVTNIRAGRSDTRAGFLAGVAGAPAALLGSLIGQWMPERQAGVLFALLMLYAAAQLVRRAVMTRSAGTDVTPVTDA